MRSIPISFEGITMANRTGVAAGVGDPAPDFPLPPGQGRPATLGGFRGRSAVVLFFYPKDHTPGCTAEACSFRDGYEDLLDSGAEVVGISGDSDESHRGFAARHGLPFLLVSDADGSIRSSYGVPKTFGLLPGRVTYVVDRRGIIRHVFSSQLRPTRHVAEALLVLRELDAEKDRTTA